MDRQESRRDFLLRGARIGAVAAISYTMGMFIVRGIGEECVNESVCDACLAISGCELPLGMEYKDDIKKGQEAAPIDLNGGKAALEIDHG